MDDNKEIETIKTKKTIKCLVMSGGGPAGFSFYGSIKELHNKGMWKLENIKSMYGTSIGSLLSIVLCLNYDWNTLDDYIIKRPWQNIFKFNMYTIIESFKSRGFFSISVFEESFLPLFKGKDISIDITLKEFYNLNNIDIHIYSTELNTYKIVDFSHKTHPDLKVIEAVYYSCSLPVIFSPILKEEKCYCDGGLITNYPLKYCILDGIDKDEIIGIKTIIYNTNNVKINLETSIFDYIFYIISKVLENKLLVNDNIVIPFEISVKTPQMSIYNCYKIISSQEERIKLIEDGKGYCNHLF